MERDTVHAVRVADLRVSKLGLFRDQRCAGYRKLVFAPREVHALEALSTGTGGITSPRDQPATVVRSFSAAVPPFLRDLTILLACALILATLAYQVPVTVRLDLGGDLRTQRVEDDLPFLEDFHGSEPVDPLVNRAPFTFRWTTERSTVNLPGMGGGAWLVTVGAVSGHPDGLPAQVRWSDGWGPLLRSTVGPVADPFPPVTELLARSDPAGDLRLVIEAPSITPPDDPRTLGLVVDRVVVQPARADLRVPAWGAVGWLLLALALVYTLARAAGLAGRTALMAALSAALAAAIALITTRMALTLLLPRLAGVLIGCHAVVAIVILAGRGVVERPAAGLVAAAFGLRLAGMLHPHLTPSDLLFHARNLQQIIRGELLISEQLPAAAGGGQVPYPPLGYLLLLPAQMLLPPDDAGRMLIVQIGSALADSLLVLLIWMLLRHGGYDTRTACLGAALYVAPAAALAAMGIGEHANLIGQVVALAALAGIARATGRSPRHLPAALLVLLLAAGLLAHLGAAISLTAALIALLAVMVRDDTTTRQARARLGAAILIGAAIAVLLYYVQYLDILLARAGSQPGTALPEVLARLGGTLGRLMRPDTRLSPLLLICGVVGLALQWHTNGARELHRLLLAWWIGAVFSLGLLALADRGVRWDLFLYPGLALGGGLTLAALARRGRAGQLVAATIVVFLLAWGVTFWITWIRDYAHTM